MNALFDVFLRRPRIAIAIAFAALVAGALSLTSLPISFFPNVARPAIVVSCTYPGANAREVMNTVAGPIEDQVNGVEGFDTMTSSCSDSGSFSLTVNFQAGFDRDLALMKVQAAVQQALTQLPQEVKNTGVTVGIGQNIDLGYVTCYSERGELSRDEIVDYVHGVVAPALKRVAGVGAASVQDEKVAMRVWLDSDRLSALGISTEEVVAAVKSQNVQASLGKVGESPTEDPSCRVLSLVAKGRLQTPAEFGEIIVRATTDGGFVRLKDVSRIELGHESFRHLCFFNGDKAACVTHLYQLPGADTFATVERMKSMLRDLEKRFPGDLKWDMTVDVLRYSRSALRGAMLAFAGAFLVAFLVLLVLFRSLRTVLVPVLACLVTLSLVLTVLAAFGFFVTVLSLYALVAALVLMIGLPALVTRACAEGRLAGTLVPTLAAGAAVAAASLVLLLVGGVQGIFLRQFAVVFAATGLFAAFVSVSLVPTLCGLFLVLRRTPEPRTVPSAPAPSVRTVVALVLVALALASAALFHRVPKDLVPYEDLGIIQVDVKTKEDSSRPHVVNVVREIHRRITETCDPEKSCMVLGEGIFTPSGENAAKLYYILKPWSERRETTREVIARLRPVVADIPEAQVSFLLQSTVPGISSSYVSPLVLSTADNDPVRLASEAHRLQAILQKLPIADDVTCGYNTDAPHLRLVVDRAKCELLKVPLSSLFATLQHTLGSVYVNDINLGIQVNRVTLMSDWKGRSTPEAMAGLYVRSATGAMVPVSALVEYEEELGPSTIYRYNRYIYCTVDVLQKPGVSLADTMDEIARVFDRELPRDFDTGWTGIAYEEASGKTRFGLMVTLSILAAFLVFVIRFESVRRAAALLAPTMAAVFGAMLLHFATGVPLSIYSRFALVVLVVLNAAFALFSDTSAGFWRRAGLPLLAAAMALPLVFTTGAGEMGSRTLGITLVGGYLAYALVGPFLSVFCRGARKEVV